MVTTEQLINEIKTDFAAFKEQNDKRLGEIEKGEPSGETAAAVNKANESITSIQNTLDELETETAEQKSLVESFEARLNRPKAGGRNGVLDIKAEQIEAYAAFENRVRPSRDGKELDPAHVDLDFIGAYADAYYDWLRRGDRASGESLSLLNEMSVGSEPGGGYDVEPDTSGRIVEFIRETSPIREFTNPVTIDRGDSLEGDYDVDEAGTGGWIGESATRSGDTSTPDIWQYRIPLFEQYAEPRTTQRYLDMTRRSNAENWLVGKVARRFARDENVAFVTGNGENKPRGFTDYGAGTPATTSVSAYTVIQQVNSGHATQVQADELQDLVFSLKSGYRDGAIFGGTRLTEAEVRKLKDGQGQYLWQPDFTQRSQARLLGFPWVEMPDMAEIAAAALAILFGNLAEGYQPVDMGGIRMLRDDLTTKGRVKFYTTKYVGGDVVNFEAIKLQKISA